MPCIEAIDSCITVLDSCKLFIRFKIMYKNNFTWYICTNILKLNGSKMYNWCYLKCNNLKLTKSYNSIDFHNNMITYKINSHSVLNCDCFWGQKGPMRLEFNNNIM